MPRKSQQSLSMSHSTQWPQNLSQNTADNYVALSRYVLPEGQCSCPIPECSYYNKAFEPHWRLNEHMKKRHGWPRKMTQPNTDRRRSGTQRSNNYPRKYKKHKLFEPVHHERSRTKRVKTSHYFDASDDIESLPINHQQDAHNAENTMNRSLDTTPADSEVLAAVHSLTRDSSPLSSANSEGETMELRSRKANTTPIKTQDVRMMAEIQAYIKQLRLMPTPPGSDLAASRADPSNMADGLQSLLSKSQILVNTTISRSSAASLFPLYKALADRAVRQVIARGGRAVYVGGLVEGEPISAPEMNSVEAYHPREQSRANFIRTLLPKPNGIGKNAFDSGTSDSTSFQKNPSRKAILLDKPRTPNVASPNKKLSLKLNFTPSSAKSSPKLNQIAKT